jgi:hypothetical protein
MNLVNIKYEKNSFDNITDPKYREIYIWSVLMLGMAQHYLRKFDNKSRGYSNRLWDKKFVELS